MSIHNAALEGQFGLVKQLVEKDRNSITAKDEDEREPLHWAASVGSVEITTLLLKKQADVNARTDSGTTPLHLACQDEHGETALVLLEAGADLDRQNEEGQTPFQYCSENLKAFLKRHGYEA
ncbi:hypothetical protein BGZ80_011000 [Entomortierella chlamydospora]|uniref:Ankyrin repeat protein n=1 Tax=Entomortierella chlamydospora TaxID=101097 RepID=A0A9P6N3P4_9FUNG|nr:hypothetical protein BGZ80_011000 [Entomortierella chlamydospora]